MKKKLKIISLILISFCGLLAIGLYVGIRYYKDAFFKAGPNYMTIERNEGGFTFEWSSSDFNGYHEPHGAILFPVRILGNERTFYMQWDSGSPTTIFYGRALFSLYTMENFPDTIISGTTPYLSNYRFGIGNNIDVSMKYARIMDYGNPVNLEDTTKMHIIGTIGSDFIDQYVFSMDFLNKEVSLSEHQPNDDQLAFEPFEFIGRRILFPAQVDGNEGLLFYDSGTSPFGIITTKSKFETYGDSEAEDLIYEVNSWGDMVSCHNKASSTPLAIGGANLTLNRVSYMAWKDGLQSFFMAFSDMKGLLGNKSLLYSTVVIDTKNHEFAVMNSMKK